MSKIWKSQEGEYLTLIRQILVYHPDAGILTIQKALAQPSKDRPGGLKLEIRYLDKLVKKINKERGVRRDKGMLSRVSELQDHYKILAAETRTILSKMDVSSADKINYLMKLFEKNIALFKAEIENLHTKKEILRIRQSEREAVCDEILKDKDFPREQKLAGDEGIFKKYEISGYNYCFSQIVKIIGKVKEQNLKGR